MRLRAPRVAVPLAAALLGFLGVVAASQPERPDRESRRLDLVDLVRQQGERVELLRSEVGILRARIAALAAGSGAAGTEVRQLAAAGERLAARAGLGALQGPGVVVTLDDSSASRSPTGDPNDLLVHEQDIQTVVNVLWRGGAEAVSLNGERLLSTSAVRCAGNTLLLHGRVHSPPYVLAAIGDPEALGVSLGRGPGMGRLLRAVESFGLQLTVDPGDVRVPAARPSVLREAVPVA